MQSIEGEHKMKLHKFSENSPRSLSLIGGIAYGIGLAGGLIGAWLLPTWVLAVALGVAFVAWVVTRRRL